MFSLNGTLKKSGSVGRWETKQFIGMALVHVWVFFLIFYTYEKGSFLCPCFDQRQVLILILLEVCNISMTGEHCIF